MRDSSLQLCCIYDSFFFRHAAPSQEGSGHLGGLCPRRGEPGWLEASQ